MAIAFSSLSEGLLPAVGNTSSVQSRTITVNSGEVLVFGVKGWKTHGANTDSINTVTFAGVPMTLVGKAGNSVAGISDRYTYIYYLQNPPASTATLTVYIAAPSILNGDQVRSAALTYTGVDTTVGVDNSAVSSLTTAATSYSPALATVADNCWVLGNFESGATVTSSAGTVLRTSSTLSEVIIDSNSVVTPAGSKTIQALGSSSVTWSAIMLSLKPAGAAVASTPTQFFMLSGVGT